MKCPKCSKDMEAVMCGDVEIDRCRSCHGIWFDKGEAEELSKRWIAEYIDTGDPVIGEKMDGIDTINCPRCGKLMTRYFDLESTQLQFEECSEHGKFFDAGEFTLWAESPVPLGVSMRWLRRFTVLALLAASNSAAAEQVVIKTNLGEIVVELYEEKSPVSVANFLKYVDQDLYDNTIFHRVIPGFMVQGGGHYRDMSEALDLAPILNEADNGLKNLRGTLAMARFSEIDSASRQFFINVEDNDNLDHDPAESCTREDEAAVAAARERGMRKPTTCKSFGYAVFGEVVSGMEFVDLIEVTETHDVGEYYDVPMTPIVILSMERVERAERLESNEPAD